LGFCEFVVLFSCLGDCEPDGMHIMGNGEWGYDEE
jgi:hypothetical protein